MTAADLEDQSPPETLTARVFRALYLKSALHAPGGHQRS
jgi:hypothetical protein